MIKSYMPGELNKKEKRDTVPTRNRDSSLDYFPGAYLLLGFRFPDHTCHGEMSLKFLMF